MKLKDQKTSTNSIYDCRNNNQIVVGNKDQKSTNILNSIYVCRNNNQIIVGNDKEKDLIQRNKEVIQKSKEVIKKNNTQRNITETKRQRSKSSDENKIEMANVNFTKKSCN